MTERIYSTLPTQTVGMHSDGSLDALFLHHNHLIKMEPLPLYCYGSTSGQGQKYYNLPQEPAYHYEVHQ